MNFQSQRTHCLVHDPTFAFIEVVCAIVIITTVLVHIYAILYILLHIHQA